MYTASLLCPDLKPKTKCIRLRKYERGSFVDLYHGHVPQHRLSQDGAIELLKSLVIRFSEFEADYIMRCYVNSRGSEPGAANPFRFQTEYPEPGVIRYSCGTNVQALCDVVIAAEQFRPASGASE
jgi:hypothetical protein